LYIVTYTRIVKHTFKTMFFYLYIALVDLVIYPSKTSLKMATKGDGNMYDVYTDYNVINSYIFMCTCWFYSHTLSQVLKNLSFEWHERNAI
jgi:hypothetical protein